MAYNSWTPNSGGSFNQFTAPPSNITNDSLRRNYGLGSKIAEINPRETPFFTFLTRFAKEGTIDPIFKSMEVRHQWQRRNFVQTALSGSAATLAITAKCDYDRRGRKVKDGDPLHAAYFVLPGQVLAIGGMTYGGNNGTVYARVSGVTHTNVDGSSDGYSAIKIDLLHHIADDGTSTKLTGQTGLTRTAAAGTNYSCQVIGTAHGEGTGAPDGWHDWMNQAEGYCQIFKTANEIVSGTLLSTELRGKKDEFLRVWTEKLKEHKMDINHAMLFGVGRVTTSDGYPTTDATDSRSKRYTWGVLPYIQMFGQTQPFTYANTSYDDFVDWMSVFFAPEDGNDSTKICLASRKIIAWFNKIGNGQSFLGNTMLQDAIKMQVKDIANTFGFTMLKVTTIFGELILIAEPLLRNLWEDYAILLDPKNITYKYLNGNGRSRDTFITTNVQDNDVDGRKDMIITEAGLEILLPETHCVIKFS